MSTDVKEVLAEAGETQSIVSQLEKKVRAVAERQQHTTHQQS